jgi:hypothetical protein
MDRAEPVRPSQQFLIARVGRRDRTRLAERAAETVDRERDVSVLVGVDTDDDSGTLKRDACHDC